MPRQYGNHYRALAESIRKEAEAIRDPSIRAHFEEIIAAYLKLANTVDRLDRLEAGEFST